MIHTVKGFGIVNKAEIDVFLFLPSQTKQLYHLLDLKMPHTSVPLTENSACFLWPLTSPTEGSYSMLKVGAPAERSYPMSKVRGGGREELPHVQGPVWQARGTTPRPRSGAAAEKSYPTSKVRSSGCVLLEQP